jgi:hypothetical protein
LIYTKFKDETSYPSYFTTSDLSDFVNTHSMNQLFIDFVFTEEKFDSNFITEYFKGLKNEKILSDLVGEKFGVGKPLGYNTKKDYYFVTNLVRSQGEETGLGGVHYPGSNGGFHVKMMVETIEKPVELATHEFGHWINFPHTFERNNNVNVIINSTMGGTKENFMDYNVSRKSWFKVQLLNRNNDDTNSKNK